MHRSNSYSHSYQHTSTRLSSNHSTSSAFSANANPNEDWTKVSDLAERRRIQNRIAQRNYRKKLKRRLEDLEKRAASSSASPEQSHEELADFHRSRSETSESPSPPAYKVTHDTHASAYWAPSTKLVAAESSPSLQADGKTLFSDQHSRHLSTSPPPTFSYPVYSCADDLGVSGCTQSVSHRSLPAFNDLVYPANYAPLAQTSNGKRLAYPEDEFLSPFSMNYASMAGIDIPTTTSPYDPAVTQPASFPQSHLYATSGVALSDSLDSYAMGGIPVQPSQHGVPLV